MDSPHGLCLKSAWKCGIGGLRNGETTYGLHNKSFNRGMMKQ